MFKLVFKIIFTRSTGAIILTFVNSIIFAFDLKIFTLEAIN